jgi:hypothetical protein
MAKCLKSISTLLAAIVSVICIALLLNNCSSSMMFEMNTGSSGESYCWIKKNKFTSEEADKWYRSNFLCDAAALLRDSNIAINEAVEWQKVFCDPKKINQRTQYTDSKMIIKLKKVFGNVEEAEYWIAKYPPLKNCIIYFNLDTTDTSACCKAILWAHSWHENGFTPEISQKWENANIKPDYAAFQWFKDGYSIEDAKIWRQISCQTPEMIKQWGKNGFTVQDISVLCQKLDLQGDFNSAEKLRNWLNAFTDTNIIKTWGRLFTDPQEAKKWMDAGFTFDETKIYRINGYRIKEAIKKKNSPKINLTEEIENEKKRIQDSVDNEICSNSQYYLDWVYDTYYSAAPIIDPYNNSDGHMPSMIQILSVLSKCKNPTLKVKGIKGLNHIKKMRNYEQLFWGIPDPDRQIEAFDSLHANNFITSEDIFAAFRNGKNLRKYIGKNCFEVEGKVEKILSVSPLQFLIGESGIIIIQPSIGNYLYRPKMRIGVNLRISGKIIGVTELKNLFTGERSPAVIIVPDSPF